MWSQKQVEIYENSVLGGEEQFIDGVKNGTIEMAITGLLIAKDEPMLGVLEIPYIFRDYDHAKKVLESEIGNELTEGFIAKMGFRSLGWTANGFRVVSSNKEIQKFEDFRGFRLRVPNADRFIKMAEALGANALPMPMPEVFTALEQKVIDGQENPYATLRASGWWEAQKFVVDTRHIFGPNLYIINENFFQTLDSELQEIVKEGAKRAAEHQWELLKNSEALDIKFLEENGLKVIYPDAEFKQKLIDSQKPVHEWFFNMVPGSEQMVERIKAVQ
jgi:tripartite ATP-independent transporter DctP family solute receptor